MEREAHLQGILHISQKPHLSRTPVMEPSLKVTFMESLTEMPSSSSSHSSSSIVVASKLTSTLCGSLAWSEGFYEICFHCHR
jgi:hypothetical protein